jgi:N6-L-threonylcarbamoyladenine synthase
VLVLGIETTCDETAAAVVDQTLRVRSSVVATQHDLHAVFGGVVPEIAARAHAQRILPTIRAALAQAGVVPSDLAAVAVAHRPGLIGALLVGLSAAKAAAWALDLPLIGVDHVHAHLFAAFLDEPNTPLPTPAAPALGLVVSGGHTSLYRVTGPDALTRLGATIDDAAGESFDKAAAVLGLPHPGGPAIDALARQPGAIDTLFHAPIPRFPRHDAAAPHAPGPGRLDFSFSGLKTALLYEAKGRPQPRAVPGKPRPELTPAPPLTPDRVRDLAATFQRAAVEQILDRVDAALTLGANPDGADRTHPDACLLVGGGVAANSRLRTELAALCARHAIPLRIPPTPYCLDNAAMIAGLGAQRLARGLTDTLALDAIPTTAC